MCAYLALYRSDDCITFSVHLWASFPKDSGKESIHRTTGNHTFWKAKVSRFSCITEIWAPRGRFLPILPHHVYSGQSVTICFNLIYIYNKYSTIWRPIFSKYSLIRNKFGVHWIDIWGPIYDLYVLWVIKRNVSPKTYVDRGKIIIIISGGFIYKIICNKHFALEVWVSLDAVPQQPSLFSCCYKKLDICQQIGLDKQKFWA